MATLAEVTGSRRLFGIVPFGENVDIVKKFPLFRTVQVSHRVKRAPFDRKIGEFETHRVRVEALDHYRVYVHPCTAPNCAEPKRKTNIVSTGEINIDREAGIVFRWHP
ncbi:MAG: hypothetical protein G01um10145_640 [Microgenomates group bacterium Gr01-1014_5]|nr:MAG: hypothetical protein G01um10145_640 [Microgenomates group bacterium Gr01-1014_5]